MFFWNSLVFSMIQQMLVIWFLVPLPFLKPSWTSGSSQFTYCWSLAWRILSITLLTLWDECNCAIVEHSLALPFLGIGMETDLFQSCGHCWVFQICWLLGASVRNSAHGKGHEEGGLAYAKAWSNLRKPPVPEHLPPKPESVLCSHLHLCLYGASPPSPFLLEKG